MSDTTIASALMLLATVTILPGCGFVTRKLGGAFNYEPEQMEEGLSDGAKRLVDAAFADVPCGGLRDYHVHVAGLGTGDAGTWFNPKKLRLGWSRAAIWSWLVTKIYLSASEVTDLRQADQQYVERLVRLMRSVEHHGKCHLLALDYYHRPDGTVDLDQGELYTPNDYVVRLSEQYPDIFVPTISVHPYRPDWREELEKWAARGVRFVKWLPNAQGIDASDPRLDDYYRVLKKHDLVLLTHVGEEQAVETPEGQALGNPLLFRRPLDQGVKIIMAHCASLGRFDDLDNPGGEDQHGFDLFLRLMSEPRYEGLLFGDISAMTQVNRLPRPLTELMEHPELHGRIVNGSDYPLPAVNCVIWTRALVKYGMITRPERKYLNEIYDYDPLLFDYVLKRTICFPHTRRRLIPARVFCANPDLPG